MKNSIKLPENIDMLLAPQRYMDEQNWKQLEQWINITQASFVKHLQIDYPMLTKEDVRIIMLIRAGLVHKEIAQIENITLKSFRMRRYRIKKKMQIICATFTEFILSLYSV